MQRTSEDLEDRLDVGDRVDVTELIARIAAERGEPVDDRQDGDDRTGVSELIARIAAERGDPIADTMGHRLLLDADARRARRRRLAPVIAGVATVVVASTVALTLHSGNDAPAGPELNAALVGSAAPSSAATDPAATETVPAPVQDDVALPPDEEGFTAPGAPSEAPAAPKATASRATAPSSAAKPAAPTAPVADDGVQAATKQGWKLIDHDEFTGTLSPKWTKYDSEGNAGKGRRTPDAITVSKGAVVIRGDEDGNTGGMSWKDDRETGRWEMRARFPKGDAQYHPVLLVWPKDGGSDDGEVDFAETTSAADSVSFFLHHGDGEQKFAKKELDLTQWHNYAVEVTADRVTGYIDGQKWFESTDRDTLPREAVHPVIQLDWFPKGDSPEPSELQVDWMRIYE
jgi:Glycosyl hydrolases family 16